MINVKQLANGIITIKDIESKLNQTYIGNYIVNP
jgi:hypothetical protein